MKMGNDLCLRLQSSISNSSPVKRINHFHSPWVENTVHTAVLLQKGVRKSQFQWLTFENKGTEPV